MTISLMVVCPSVLFLWASLTLLMASPASSAALPSLGKNSNTKQGDAFWRNSFDISQKSDLKSVYSKTNPFTETESPNKLPSKDEEMSAKTYVGSSLFRKQRPEPNKEEIDEIVTTEAEIRSTGFPEVNDLTVQQVQMTERVHAIPIINPPIWMQERSPDNIFDPIRNNEQFDTYDRYSHSIRHGVFHMRTRMF